MAKVLAKAKFLSNCSIVFERLLDDGTSRVVHSDFEGLGKLVASSISEVEGSARVGFMPFGFIDAVLTGDNTFAFFQYIPEGKYPFVWGCEKDECMSVYYPHMFFAWDVRNGVVENTYLYALAQPVKDKGSLNQRVYSFPYSNVYPDGRICWGSNRISDISSIYDMSYYYMNFFTSISNKDLFVNAEGVSFLEFARGMEEAFDYSKLFPVLDGRHGFHTVSSVMDTIIKDFTNRR